MTENQHLGWYQKISPKCVRKGLIELSTMSSGGTAKPMLNSHIPVNESVELRTCYGRIPLFGCHLGCHVRFYGVVWRGEAS